MNSLTLASLVLATVAATTITSTHATPAGPSNNSPAQISASPRLERRQLDPIGTTVASVGIHKTHTNARMVVDVQRQLNSLEHAVAGLENMERRMHSHAQLQRRLIATAIGATGIHKSNDLRVHIRAMIKQAVGLRNRVNHLLEQEGLPVTHRPNQFNLTGKRLRRHRRKHRRHLERRQLGLGMILGPVSLHKANRDRRVLDAIVAVIRSCLADMPRVHQMQSEIMADRGGPGAAKRVAAGARRRVQN